MSGDTRHIQRDMDAAQKKADILKALAHPVRVRVFEALAGSEKTVGELVTMLGEKEANTSRHLAVLRNAGLVATRKEGLNVFYSNKIIGRSADWKITASNPTIHLLEYHAPWEEHELFNKKFPKEKLAELKKEVYEQTIAKKGEIDSETVRQIFLRNGIECKPENLTTKEVNVYELVKRTAAKFGFPTPEVVVSNTIIPNASASGPGPRRGIVLITTGLLVHLEDDEIISVGNNISVNIQQYKNILQSPNEWLKVIVKRDKVLLTLELKVKSIL